MAQCQDNGHSKRSIQIMQDSSFWFIIPLSAKHSLPAGIYLLKVNNRNTRQGAKYVQN